MIFIKIVSLGQRKRRFDCQCDRKIDVLYSYTFCRENYRLFIENLKDISKEFFHVHIPHCTTLLTH